MEDGVEHAYVFSHLMIHSLSLILPGIRLRKLLPN